VHGDAWDRFLTQHPILTNLADWFYLWVQQMSRKLAVSAKRSSKTFLRCVGRVREGASVYGKTKNMDVVVCSHTHHAEALEGDGQRGGQPTYYNTGRWTNHHCHYWTAHDGVTQLHEVTVTQSSLAKVLV